MQRRDFLKSAAGASALPFAGGSSRATAAGTETPGAAKDPTQFVLNEVTIDDLQRRMQRGEVTARSLAELYLGRIDAVDRQGPALRSVIESNPDALAIAGELDRERSAGRVRGPLHGIPVLIKDNIDTGDRMMTTAGSLAMEGHRARKDAGVARRLREAGAVLLGKTNLSEWANFRSTRSSSGWSSRGGQTRNPHVLDRNPSGSSSGSAAAVSANLCAVAVGTETDGSIIAPSAFCGVVGLKPTVGLVSRDGIIPISASQDTAGPMTRTVRDAALLLNVVAGADPADPATTGTAAAGGRAADYTRFLDRNALRGVRLGIERSFLKGHPGVVACYRSALAVLREAGATLIEVELMAAVGPLGAAEMQVLQYEFKDGLNRYLAAAGAPVKSLADVIAFNRRHEARVMPGFKQELLEASEARGPLTDPAYRAARERTRAAESLVRDLMQRHGVRAIAGVSIGLPHLTDPVHGDRDTGFYFCAPAAMAGFPHLTVPMGRVRNLPLGLSFMAGAWDEGRLLGFGYAFEQATHHRVAPRFLRHVDEPVTGG